MHEVIAVIDLHNNIRNCLLECHPAPQCEPIHCLWDDRDRVNKLHTNKIVVLYVNLSALLTLYYIYTDTSN